MFDNLSERLTQSFKKIRGQGRLTEDNIKDTLREVRMALLEADVALPVVKAFIERIKTRALGQEVQSSLTPGQAFVKIVHQELIEVIGGESSGLDLATQPPAVILMAGLQGAGKTTSVAKLARWLKERQKKKVAVVSTDVYRPAAIDQLETLAGEVGVEFVPSTSDEDPVTIAQRAVDYAKKHLVDAVLIDSAGRLHIDQAMMGEIQAIHAAVHPIETLFVVDSMTGQDAANTAKAFHDALPLTGVVLTKADGDARGGAALSIRHITGKPIKFIGTGEKSDALELFHPDRIASRILGMGDVLSLIEEVESKIDRGKAEKFANKIQKGKGFDLADMRDQLMQLNKMGGVSKLLDKLPGMGELPKNVKESVNDRDINRQIAIINAMTPHERRFPAVINNSRKRRIAGGSGVQIQDVNRLLKQFGQMQKMMKKMKKKKGFGKGGFPGMPGGGMPKMPF
ncbi:signal recognition particle protein [Methylohalobius crimeensis]|uniref:signal recognition particle protein n=1 Tax=Methylohalobius crimeensis TaxID=244365 RepID=UPI0003B4EA78|nr:signal recognition particle protein [Methylohalobius crimeensis]